jgi:hypothetical protein
MSQHLDLDALADVLADGHEPEHLQGCESCRARLSELGTATAAVSGSLAALAPPELPEGLADRLAAAVDAERAPAPANVLPLQPRRTRWLPALGAVAAAAAVVVGAVVLTGGGGDGSSTTSDLALDSGYAVNETGADYSDKTLASALPQLLKGGAAATELQAPKATTALGATPGPTQARAGSSFDTAAPLAAPDPLAALRDTAGLAACQASLTDPSESGIPLALDYASYKGTPALVVVLPSTKPDKVDVFVVPAGCAKADGTVLYFTRLPKP